MFEVRLAPMCGITDHIFRTICYRMGCDLAYTEMVSAMGYLCAPNQRATQELLVRGPEEPRLILQLFGRDPDVVAEAAYRLSELKRFDGIDLNMGCPAKKIAPSGEGCGLMRTPEIAFRMMKKTVLSTNLPVSVKIRLGYDNEHINALEFAQMAEEAGLRSVTIPGRTREQQYSGEADWDMIGRIKRQVHIPVFGNGDIFTAADAFRKQAASRTDGVMIGRGAMGNPWIFRQIKSQMNHNPDKGPSPEERKEMILRHYRYMLRDRPEEIAVREMRKHICWYIKGLRGAGKLRSEINQCPSSSDTMLLIDRFFNSVTLNPDDEREAGI